MSISIHKCLTPTDKEKGYKYRYEVYVKELHFEKGSQNKKEIDADDNQSDHYLIKDNGLEIGYFRIINKHSTLCQEHKLSNDTNYHEISRFFILPQYRKSNYLSKIINEAKHTLREYEYVYCIIDKRFARGIKKYGIIIEKMSDDFECRGRRALYRLSVRVD